MDRDRHSTSAVKAITTHNCSAAEDATVQQCSAPLDDITARLDELFSGGLQSLLKNLNNLAPVFAQGECQSPSNIDDIMY